eukprot:TRINITY_DN13167_c0_g1_i1.p1 TRINITY_DN13167_c0_g1~~TRINITY_DN13167_c0_g1_i1.p1  ORF type:complete len:920 (-),score=199.54 TRINITY_DN13167_c0_g1_i1:132-2891(-)
MTEAELVANGTGVDEVQNLLQGSNFEQLLSTAWILLCTFLVVSMQLGFAMLEVGSCRAAHRMTVLAKNVLDSSVSAVGFWMFCEVGYPNWTTMLATGSPDGQTPMLHMQLMAWAFSVSAVTVCSGSMAERVHVVTYVWYAFTMSFIIYPPLAEAVWGVPGDENSTTLRDRLQWEFRNRVPGYAYHDFAGSGVVHLLGGIGALVGNLLLGRRIMASTDLDEDDSWCADEEDGPMLTAAASVRAMRKSGDIKRQMVPEGQLKAADMEAPCTDAAEDGSKVWLRRFDDSRRDKMEFRQCGYLQALGMFIMWVGWYGFNTGPVLSLDKGGAEIAGIIAWNTTLCAAGGGVGAFLNCYCIRQHLDVGFLCNGFVGGLVAISAACDVASEEMCMAIGFLAGLIVYPSASQLLQWLKLDDPVDAISVHAACGLFGVIAVSFCRPDCQYLATLKVEHTRSEPERFCRDDHSMSKQFLAQLYGAIIEIVWCGITSAIFFSSFAVCEYAGAFEVPHLEEAEALLESCEESMKRTSGRTPGGSTPLAPLAGTAVTPNYAKEARWRELAGQSPVLQSLLEEYGWTVDGGFCASAASIRAVRWELMKVREGRYETALEGGPRSILYCLGLCLWKVSRFMSRFSPKAIRMLMPTFRLRISPVAELSGLGASEVNGGQLRSILKQTVISPLKLYEEQQAMTALEMKREMQELSLLVGSQDSLLQTLTRSMSNNHGNIVMAARRARMQTHETRSESSGISERSLLSGSTLSRMPLAQVPEVPEGQGSSGNRSGQGSGQGSGQASPFQNGHGGQDQSPLRLPNGNSASTVAANDMLSPMSMDGIATPPPTLLGISSLAGRVSAPPPRTQTSTHRGEEQLAQDLIAALERHHRQISPETPRMSPERPELPEPFDAGSAAPSYSASPVSQGAEQLMRL